MELSALPKTRKEAQAIGSLHYFTGMPCKYGHISRRVLSSKSCAECGKNRIKAWRAGNPEKNRERNAKYNRTEKRKVYNKELKRSEKGVLARKAYYERNKERINRSSLEWRANNLERDAANRKRWLAENKEVTGAYCRNRQARIRGAKGKHTKLDILAMYARQQGKCLCCHAALMSGYDVDHKNPLSKGGSNDPSNLQLLCPRCNRSKGNMDYLEWCTERGISAES